jgi:hypothetical protein
VKFRRAAEAAGTGDLSLEFAVMTTVSAFRVRLAEAMPALRPLLESVAVAVNEERAAAIRRSATAMRRADPADAGGAEESNVTTNEMLHFLCTSDVLDCDALRDLVRTDEAAPWCCSRASCAITIRGTPCQPGVRGVRAPMSSGRWPPSPPSCASTPTARCTTSPRTTARPDGTATSRCWSPSSAHRGTA